MSQGKQPANSRLSNRQLRHIDYLDTEYDPIRGLPLEGENPQSFAFAVRPLPGEGLIDLLFRCVADNGFHKMKILNRFMGVSVNLKCSHFTFARQDIDPGHIAKMIGIDEEEIEPLIYRKPNKRVEFFGTVISPFYLSDLRRVSPRFLDQAGYQRAIWGLRCFSFDPFNRETLLTHCPGCETPLTANIAVGVFYCSRCRADLRDFPQDLVQIEDEAALSFVLSLINPEKNGSALPSLADCLQEFSKGEIFSLIVTLGKLLHLHYSGGVNQKIVTKTEHNNLPHTVLIEASAAVLGWPGTFLETAEKIRGSKGHIRNRSNHPLTLGLPVVYKQLRTLVANELRRGSLSGQRTEHHFKSASGRETVSFNFPPSVNDEVAAIGLPVSEVLSLYRVEAIRCPDERLRNRLGLSTNARPLDLKALEERGGVDFRGSTLADVVLASKPSRHPWARALAAIFDGEVTYSIMPNSPRRLVNRIFTSQENLLNEICASADTEVDEETPITSSKVESFYLSLSYETIQLLKTTGFLPKGTLRMRDVWSFQDQFMSTAEIRARTRPSVGWKDSRHLWMLIEAYGFRRVIEGAAFLRRDDGEAFLKDFTSCV